MLLLMVDAAVRRAGQEQDQSQGRVSDKELFAKMGTKPRVIPPKRS